MWGGQAHERMSNSASQGARQCETQRLLPTLPVPACTLLMLAAYPLLTFAWKAPVLPTRGRPRWEHLGQGRGVTDVVNTLGAANWAAGAAAAAPSTHQPAHLLDTALTAPSTSASRMRWPPTSATCGEQAGTGGDA